MAAMLRLLALASLAAAASARRVLPGPRPPSVSGGAHAASFVDLAARAKVALPPALHEAFAGVSLPPALLELYSGADTGFQASMRKAMEDSVARAQACGESCQDPDSPEAAMQAAVETAKLTVGVVSDVTTYILSNLDAVRDEVNQNADKMRELADANIDDFSVKVARATVTIGQCQNRARAMYGTLLDTTQNIINDLNGRLGSEDADALRTAIGDAQRGMSAALEAATQELQALVPMTGDAETQFAEIGALSANYEQRVQEKINGENNWLDNKKSDLRAKVYGGCAAGIIFPPVAIACYATAAGILESHIKDLERDLANTKAALNSIARKFGSLKDLSNQMEHAASESYGQMAQVSSKLQSTSRIVDASPNVSWWKGYAIKDLEALAQQLREKMG